MLKILLCFCLLMWLHLPGHAQDTLLTQQVTLNNKNVTIEHVLDTLTKTYGISFSYSKDVVPLQQRVNIQANGEALSEVLQQVFAGTDIEFTLIGEQIVLKRAAFLQVPPVIRGKVFDKATKEPLAYASIQVSGKSLGTTTLASGAFTLKIHPHYRQDTLVISYIGYTPVRKPVAEYVGEWMEIELAQETKQLNEVIVQSITGLSILQQVITKIPENYDTAAFNLSFFLRERVFHDGGPIRVNEAVYEGYSGSLKGNATKQVKLLTNRNRKYYAEYQGILSTFPKWTGYEVSINRTAILDNLAALHGSKENFLVPGGFTYHDFVLTGTGTMHGREVYIIDFDQKDQYRNKALYKGTLYIDVACMAIIKSVVDLSPKGIKNTRFFNSPKAAAMLFGFGKCAVTKQQTITTYKESYGKWYVDSLQSIYETHLVKDKWNFDSFVYFKADMVVTDIIKDQVAPLAESDQVTNLELHQEQYDKDFWQNYTDVKPDIEFEHAFHLIDSLNKLHPYNEKFWKRYKMDKYPAPTPVSSAFIQSTATKNGLSDDLMLPLSKSKETRHFKFIYTAVDTASIEAIAGNLEDNYHKILTELKVNNQPKVEVTIYPSIRAYHLAINNPQAHAYEVGSATGKEAFRIVSPVNPGPVWNYEFMMKAFIHEFTHCVHYTILEGVNTKRLAAMSAEEGQGTWLFEAIACYEAGQFFPPAEFSYLKEGDYPTLAQLNNNEKIYDVGYVLIEYIKTKWGIKALNHLIRTNGNIKYCLGISEKDFEQGFYTYLKLNYLQ